MPCKRTAWKKASRGQRWSGSRHRATNHGHAPQRFPVNIYMLMAQRTHCPYNNLAVRMLRYVPFHNAKRHVLRPETGRFTSPNGTLRITRRHTQKDKATLPVFSFIYASSGKARIALSISALRLAPSFRPTTAACTILPNPRAAEEARKKPRHNGGAYCSDLIYTLPIRSCSTWRSSIEIYINHKTS